MIVPDSGPIFLKREDLSKIRSYKWRGSFNRINKEVANGNRGPFVATSAGNHAQGVALAVAHLNVSATIFMPQTTPKLKQKAAKLHGGENVEIVLVGDTFDAANKAAMEFTRTNHATVIPPFDDIDVIAGQSTVADEIHNNAIQMDFVFVPIGGGGLASGVAFAYSEIEPNVKVIGVEVVGQDSMNQSINNKEQVLLDRVDRFCDGTAVARPGNITFAICKDYLAEVVTVTNEQVCAAIQMLWEEKRVITEPSGAIALAGLIKSAQNKVVDLGKHKCTAVISGGNTDFLTLPTIVKQSQLAQSTRKYFRFEIDEKNGALIGLLDQFLDGINIVDFQYGKSAENLALPVLGISASTGQLTEFSARIAKSNLAATEVTDHSSTLFRVIPFRPDLTSHAVFLHVDFPDRPGALREMMREISSITNICYFNFDDSGQSEGHALIGFEFANPNDQSLLLSKLAEIKMRYRNVDMSRLIPSG